MKPATIERGGRRFVLLPVAEYERLIERAGPRPQALPPQQQAPLPPLPPVAADGTCDAIEFARASIARKLNAERTAAGLSQHELARLAGVRQETISRIESGKHTATVRVMQKLERALSNRSGPRRRRSA